MNRARVARWLTAGVLVALIAVALWNRESVSGPAIEAWLARLGPLAAPAFVLLYAIGALLFFPGSVMTLAGGAVFGPVKGTLLSLLGATAGAAIAFLLARVLGRDWAERRLPGNLLRMVQGLEEDGWRFIAFVRLVPLFPYNVLNYALGVTRIRFGTYVFVSALCMAPGAAAFTYLGSAGREALEGGTQSALQTGLIGLALLATAMFLLPRLATRLRRD